MITDHTMFIGVIDIRRWKIFLWELKEDDQR